MFETGMEAIDRLFPTFPGRQRSACSAPALARSFSVRGIVQRVAQDHGGVSVFRGRRRSTRRGGATSSERWKAGIFGKALCRTNQDEPPGTRIADGLTMAGYFRGVQHQVDALFIDSIFRFTGGGSRCPRCWAACRRQWAGWPRRRGWDCWGITSAGGPLDRLFGPSFPPATTRDPLRDDLRARIASDRALPRNRCQGICPADPAPPRASPGLRSDAGATMSPSSGDLQNKGCRTHHRDPQRSGELKLGDGRRWRHAASAVHHQQSILHWPESSQASGSAVLSGCQSPSSASPKALRNDRSTGVSNCGGGDLEAQRPGWSGSLMASGRSLQVGVISHEEDGNGTAQRLSSDLQWMAPESRGRQPLPASERHRDALRYSAEDSPRMTTTTSLSSLITPITWSCSKLDGSRGSAG